MGWAATAHVSPVKQPGWREQYAPEISEATSEGLQLVFFSQLPAVGDSNEQSKSRPHPAGKSDGAGRELPLPWEPDEW